MKRKILKELLEWKNNELRKEMPYMLIGARQTGKTYVLDEFCRDNYEKYVYINFEDNPEIIDVFDKTLNPEEIMDELSLRLDFNFHAETTAVFFDEIQQCPRAITALKYFCESKVKYTVVCAGSLLGVALNRLKFSFPVGKVVRNHMYPMDFEEFLWATGRERLASEIRKYYMSNKTMSEGLHDKLLGLYKNYLIVGGMPKSVLDYIDKKEMLSEYNRDIKKDILNDYINDMKKYTTNIENIKIEKVYKSIPRQLGRDNNKFNYKLIEESARKSRFETAIDWLLKSELVSNCVFADIPEKSPIPLVAYEKREYFKLYLSDIGLLTELSNIGPRDLFGNEVEMFSGMIAENYVACMLKKTDRDLHYWKSNKDAEIDFLETINGNVIPIEVKASTNTKSKSLKVYQGKYNPKYSIRVSAKNFAFVNKIKSVPLYAVHLIGELDN